MQLELAIVQSCTDTGCNVQLLDSREIIETIFSPTVIDYQIRIIPHQLVIVNRSANPPQLIWRWTRATITNLSGSEIELRHDDGRHLRASRAPDMDTALTIGDVIFLTGFKDENWTIVDVAVDGRPAHPDRLSAALFPTIHP